MQLGIRKFAWRVAFVVRNNLDDHSTASMLAVARRVTPARTLVQSQSLFSAASRASSACRTEVACGIAGASRTAPSEPSHRIDPVPGSQMNVVSPLGNVG